MGTSEIRVIGICGSLRRASYTRLAVRLALTGAEAAGAHTELIDLQDYELPFCSGMMSEEDLPNEVIRLRRDVSRAHGIILGTPEYHGGMSGVLKNALDLMGFDEFENKIVGLLGVAGGSAGAVRALTQLRTVGRSLHAWVIPHEASVAEARKQFDSSGMLHDEELSGRIRKLGTEVAKFAMLMAAKESEEFLHEFTRAPVNPGGGAKRVS